MIRNTTRQQRQQRQAASAPVPARTYSFRIFSSTATPSSGAAVPSIAQVRSPDERLAAVDIANLQRGASLILSSVDMLKCSATHVLSLVQLTITTAHHTDAPPAQYCKGVLHGRYRARNNGSALRELDVARQCQCVVSKGWWDSLVFITKRFQAKCASRPVPSESTVPTPSGSDTAPSAAQSTISDSPNDSQVPSVLVTPSVTEPGAPSPVLVSSPMGEIQSSAPPTSTPTLPSTSSRLYQISVRVQRMGTQLDVADEMMRTLERLHTHCHTNNCQAPAKHCLYHLLGQALACQRGALDSAACILDGPVSVC